MSCDVPDVLSPEWSAQLDRWRAEGDPAAVSAPPDTGGDWAPAPVDWDPHGMIADAYAGRPIQTSDWEMLCRWFDVDEAANLLAQLQAEGGRPGGGGVRDNSNDGARPAGGAGRLGGPRWVRSYWMRRGPVNLQDDPFGPIARAIMRAVGIPHD